MAWVWILAGKPKKGVFGGWFTSEYFICGVAFYDLFVHSVKFTVYSIQFTVYSIKITVYRVQLTVCSIQFTMYSIQGTVFGSQCTALRSQCTVSGSQCTVFSSQCTFWVQAHVKPGAVVIDCGINFVAQPLTEETAGTSQIDQTSHILVKDRPNL